MEKMKVAVIGCGTIANDAHIPAYMKNDTCEIKYFCDLIPERAEAAVKKYGCGTAVTDYFEVLRDPEVKAISVCTHTNNHTRVSIDAMRAGKHVLSEKPAARTLAEALEMQKVQHETGMTLNIGVVNRFRTTPNKVKELIDAGELGNIYHVYASFRAHRSIPGIGGDFTTKAVAGGGCLIDWGVHFLDLIMYCLGDPKPETVSGQAYSVLGVNMREYVYKAMHAARKANYDGTYDVDDFVTGLIRTAGPTISLNGAWAQNIAETEMYVDFLGDKAGIRLNYGGGYTLYTTSHHTLVTVKPDYDEENGFQNEIDAFLDCVRTGKKLPSHIDTAIITAQIMQAIYDSSETRREIVL
ncbi:MAG: Gfo/Idh/MocA family oxidoreductase [Clostridia bacterium]|nr:Gfo/Idh/MocA family oxidoreductase [Oscillospiraceae bacterium]MBR6747733.1 Gfo/Idh/MocA family oxidoreductase [Clostridia bacterium]